jgi:hypothetical protein
LGEQRDQGENHAMAQEVHEIGKGDKAHMVSCLAQRVMDALIDWLRELPH